MTVIFLAKSTSVFDNLSGPYLLHISSALAISVLTISVIVLYSKLRSLDKSRNGKNHNLDETLHNVSFPGVEMNLKKDIENYIKTDPVQSNDSLLESPSDFMIAPTEVRAALTWIPKAEILISAGPRKTSKDTELGEDVAGTVVTKDRIYFWVLDGTSDSAQVTNEKGRELFSSRLFALAISNALYRVAPKYTDPYLLSIAAIKMVTAELDQQASQHQEQFQKYIAGQPADTPHWDVSTTMLVGVLDANGDANIFRIGDSKVIVYTEDGKVNSTTLSQRPSSTGLGRVYARLKRDPAGRQHTIKLFPPERAEQLHQEMIPNIRRIMAFSDGIGNVTQQYLLKMYPLRSEEKFHDELARTPNDTFDDKTLVIVSFEALG